MKKLTLLFLTLAFSLALIGCNNTTPPDVPPEENPPESETPPESTPSYDAELPRVDF